VKITEEEIRKITQKTIESLGKSAPLEKVEREVASLIKEIETSENPAGSSEITSGKIILTSFGINHPGIVASITKSFSDNLCDILDISQKILGDFYTMIMIVDITKSLKDLRSIQEEMNKISEELKIKIYLQHEDVFRYMHRI